MPEPGKIEELLFWLERLEETRGAGFATFNDPGEELLQLLGITQSEWYMGDIGPAGRARQRWFLVRDKLYSLYGVIDPQLDRTRTRQAAGGRPLDDLRALNRVMAEEVRLQTEAGVILTPPTETAPRTVPMVTGRNLSEIGKSWLGAVAMSPGGQEVVDALRNRPTPVRYAVIGELLATAYAGGTRTVASELEKWVGEELASLVAYRMTGVDADTALGNYYRGQDERAVAEFMLDVASREVMAVYGKDLTHVPTADEVRKTRLSLSKELWGEEETDDELKAMTDVDKMIRNQLLSGKMAVTWYEIVAQTPALKDAIFKRTDLIDVSDDIITRLFDTLLRDDPTATLASKEKELDQMVNIYRMETKLRSGDWTQAQFDEAKRDSMLGSTISADVWSLYEKSVTPTPDTAALTISSLTFWGLVRDRLVESHAAQVLGLTPEQMALMKTAYDSVISNISGDVDFDEIATSWTERADEDPAIIRALEAKGPAFETIRRAIYYVASDFTTTTNKTEFTKLVDGYFAKSIHAGNLTDEEAIAIAISKDLLWDEFKTVSGARGAGDGMFAVLDPNAWLGNNFDTWLAEHKAAALAGEKTPIGALFEASLREVEEAGTSLEVALANNLSPRGQVMWSLGYSLFGSDRELSAESAAEFIFEPRPGETAEEYYERVETTLRARAREQKLTNPKFEDIYGLTKSDTDFGEVVEDFARGVMPDEVGVAARLGITIDDVRSRRRQMIENAAPIVSPAALQAARDAMASQDFVDMITPIIRQLPVGERQAAFENAITMEEQLRAEFLASLPRGEDEQPLQGQQLANFISSQQQERSDQLTTVAERAVAEQFGISIEDVRVMGSLGMAREFQEGLAEIFARAGEVVTPPPPETGVTAEAAQAAALAPGAPGAVAPGPTDLTRPTPSQVAQAMRRQRAAFGAGQPDFVPPATFEEFVRRQKGTRFSVPGPATPSEQLATRRVR